MNILVTFLVAIVACASISTTVLAASENDAAKRGTKNLTESFDVGVDALPKDFSGHSYKTLVNALRKNKRPEKSEFETHAEYEKRVDKWRSRKLFGNVDLNSRFAFSEFVMQSNIFHKDDLKARYNADDEVMTLSFSPKCEGRPGVQLALDRKDLGSYVGQNAFGVRKLIQRTLYHSYCLELPPDSSFFPSFEIKRRKAESTAYMLRYVLIGTLMDRQMDTEQVTASSPTISSPQESSLEATWVRINLEQFWVVDGITGEILFKKDLVSEREKKAQEEAARLSAIVGSWVDYGTGAVRTIYLENDAWKMSIKIPRGSSYIRDLAKLSDNSFEWVSNGRSMGNIYRIDANGDLSIFDKGRLSETMKRASANQ